MEVAKQGGTSKLGAEGRRRSTWIGGDKRKNRKGIADRSREWIGEEHGQRSKATAACMHGMAWVLSKYVEREKGEERIDAWLYVDIARGLACGGKCIRLN